MPHLDEGILSALLDGELMGAEQQEVEAHLRGCAECRDRLAELKGFMQVADQLVTELDDVPLTTESSEPLHRRRNYRALAWAASIVLAVGMGFAGRSVLQKRSVMNASGEVGAMSQKAGPVSDAPTPASPQPSTQAPADAEGVVAIGSAQRPVESTRRAAEVREEAPAPPPQAGQDAERRPGRSDSVAVDALDADSTGLRRDLASNLDERQAGKVNETAAAAGAPGQPGFANQDSLQPESRAQSGVAELDAAGFRTRASSKEAAAPPQSAPAMLQPRDEALRYAPLARVGTRVIPMEEAVRVLGGTIRLVDSLTPVRMELVSADSTIRVLYVTAGVEVWLEQRRDRGSVAALAARPAPEQVKLASGSNQLSWNDLQGFYLTLTGPLPTAALLQIKARIR